MKKKIIGILVCTLVLMTSVPTLGQISRNDENNQVGCRTCTSDEQANCGTCYVILVGDEEGKIDAKIRFYHRLCWFVIPWNFWEEPVSQINCTTGMYPPFICPAFDGEYASFTTACGAIRAVYVPPSGSGYYSVQKPDMTLKDGVFFIVFIDIVKI